MRILRLISEEIGYTSDDIMDAAMGPGAKESPDFTSKIASMLLEAIDRRGGKRPVVIEYPELNMMVDPQQLDVRNEAVIDFIESMGKRRIHIAVDNINDYASSYILESSRAFNSQVQQLGDLIRDPGNQEVFDFIRTRKGGEDLAALHAELVPLTRAQSSKIRRDAKRIVGRKPVRDLYVLQPSGDAAKIKDIGKRIKDATPQYTGYIPTELQERWRPIRNVSSLMEANANYFVTYGTAVCNSITSAKPEDNEAFFATASGKNSDTARLYTLWSKRDPMSYGAWRKKVMDDFGEDIDTILSNLQKKLDVRIDRVVGTALALNSTLDLGIDEAVIRGTTVSIAAFGDLVDDFQNYGAISISIDGQREPFSIAELERPMRRIS